LIRNKKLVVIIPARKGSKGIKNKNFLKINKKSLIEKTIQIAKKCKFVDKIILSTNSKKYFDISKKLEANSICIRPNNISKDFSSIFDVINHEVNINNIRNSYILLLQPTSPFRTLKLLNIFLKNFKKYKKYISAISVSELDEVHPHKVQKINKNNYLSSFIKNADSSVPRQLLPKFYKLNGMFYIANVRDILKNNSFFTKKTMPFIINGFRSINLDNYKDIILMKYFINKHLV
jgi:CMP-N-acetylneuraminic acid synthetase